MTVWNAILLGFVQGLSEFLPISSSGHLSIINNLFNMSVNESHMFFDVLLHMGTLISIVLVYWNDLAEMFKEVISFANLGPYAGKNKERYPAARLFVMIIIATLPMVLILPIRDMMDGLYTNSIFIGISIILTGCALFVSDRMKEGKKTVGSMSVLDAVIIGICQCVATIPGLSRSGITITAGIATGIRREFAVKFSFLMSIPAVFGATVVTLADAVKAGINWADVPAYLVGMAVAMVTGVGAIFLIKFISKRGKFGGFAYYCWVMGVLSIILTMIF